jgi:S-DNA-T family DNA segregation ATPase FtsK/SpoIIIE
MDIMLTISDLQSGEAHPVVLTTPPDARFEDVEPLLTQFIDRHTVWRVHGHGLLPDDVLVDAGVCDGAVLEAIESVGGPVAALSVPESSMDGVIAHLQVVRGPDVGTSWTLRPGTYVIGRSKTSDLPLASDEMVSRQHARIKISAEGALLEDMASSNGTLVDGVSIATQTRVASGAVIELGDTFLSLSVESGPGATTTLTRNGTRIFNRPPRILDRPEPVRLSVPTPPGQRQDVAFSVVGIVLPLIIGGAMAILVKPIFILFALLSPVMAISTYVTNRRRGGITHRAAMAQYQDRKARYANDLRGAIDRETTFLRAASPDPAEVAAIAGAPLTRLWERRRDDPDFLSLRLGLANQGSSIELIGGSRPDDPDSLPEDQPMLMGVPATVDLAAVGILGLAGETEPTERLSRWLVCQLAVLHAPDDLQLVILAGDDDVDEWEWSMWLPHLRMNGGISLGFGEDAATHLGARLAAATDARIQRHEKTRVNDQSQTDPAIVVVLGASQSLRSIPGIAQILRLGPSVGVYCICIAETSPQLPEECRAVATFRIGMGAPIDLRLPTGSGLADIVPDQVGRDWAEELARNLAPLRIDRQRHSSAGIPDALVLLDLLEMEPPNAQTIADLWALGGRTTAALIGATASGPFALDLSKDGPHGLVAGTTGSGKSELLQTLIASLAVANRPDALNFVLVDYKGGSAFSACSRLPHTVGMVTDLDGHLTERALISLAAEVRDREQLFRSVGAKDIDDYWRGVDRVGPTPSVPMLARIVIVIDEFASLVEEIPEFVDGLVDLARRGRSFGIHLILATQRPAGVVSPAIKTNTNLRVAMRVTDAMDSTDVIDSQVAAHIAKDTPGRAFARVGHDQLIEFQAARVGGRRRRLDASRSHPSLRALVFTDLYRPPPAPLEPDSADDVTDLDVLVNAVVAASEMAQIAPVGSPWLPPLPEVLTLNELRDDRPDTTNQVIPFGLEDLPSERDRAVVRLDLGEGGHLIVAGDPGSGRSTVLRTIAGAAADRLNPTELHLYGIDCGNGALAPLAELPHCGAVVTRSEIERTDRLLSKLTADVGHRQSTLAAGGFSSVAEQHLHCQPSDRLPYLLLMIDRWEGFTTAFESFDGGRLVSSLQYLLREGSSAGLSIVLTGDRSVLLGKMATMTEFRLVLRLNDRASYSLAGLNPRHLPDEIPAGRAFRADSGREIQIALLAPETGGPPQVRALLEIADRARSDEGVGVHGSLPEPIAVIPARVTLESVMALGPTEPRPLSATVGVGGNRLEPVLIDLLANGPGYIVAGPRRSGRSNALVALGRSLISGTTRIVGVTTLPSPLERLAGTDGVEAVLNGRVTTPEEIDVVLARTTGPLAILVDDVEQLFDTPLAAHLEGLIRGAHQHNRAVVLAGGVAELNSASFRGPVAEARKSRSGLLLSPSAPTDAELFGVRLPRTAVFSGPAGRAVQIDNGSHRIVQIADASGDAGTGSA